MGGKGRPAAAAAAPGYQAGLAGRSRSQLGFTVICEYLLVGKIHHVSASRIS